MADAIVLLGAGGHARVMAEAIAAEGKRLVGHVAPEVDTSGLLGPHLGDDLALPALLGQGVAVAVGIGFVDAAGAKRRAALIDWLDGLAAELATVVHPAAILSPSARLEPGCFLAAGAMVASRAWLGRVSIVNTGAIVEHDSVTGANCHVATGAQLTGGSRLGRDVLIGAGAVLRQGLEVGDGAVVAAGAVVIRPVAPGGQVMGNPARQKQP